MSSLDDDALELLVVGELLKLCHNIFLGVSLRTDVQTEGFVDESVHARIESTDGVVLPFLDELDVVLLFVPLGAVESQVWLEHAGDIEVCHPFRIHFANVEQEFVARALSHNQLCSDEFCNGLVRIFSHCFADDFRG